MEVDKSHETVQQRGPNRLEALLQHADQVWLLFLLIFELVVVRLHIDQLAIEAGQHGEHQADPHVGDPV